MIKRWVQHRGEVSYIAGHIVLIDRIRRHGTVVAERMLRGIADAKDPMERLRRVGRRKRHLESIKLQEVNVLKRIQ